MDILLDVAVVLTIITASVSIVYMVRDFVQNIMLKDKFFEQYITKGWIARNFDTTALLVSIPALIWFFDPLSGYWTIRSFVEYNTLLVGALLGFPILIKRVDTNQEILKETQKTKSHQPI